MYFEIFSVLFAVFSYDKNWFGLKIFITELHFENKYNGAINYQSLQLMFYWTCLSICDTIYFFSLIVHHAKGSANSKNFAAF